MTHPTRTNNAAYLVPAILFALAGLAALVAYASMSEPVDAPRPDATRVGGEIVDVRDYDNGAVRLIEYDDGMICIVNANGSAGRCYWLDGKHKETER